MYRRYQNRATQAHRTRVVIMADTLPARRRGRKRFVRAKAFHRSGVRTLSLDHKRPDSPDEILLGRLMLYERDHGISPQRVVLDREVVAVRVEKLHHRHKTSAFVPLCKRVRLSDAR